MREKEIKIGQILYIKKSAIFGKRNERYLIVKKDKNKNGITYYYNNKNEKIRANELTKISCEKKHCPCEYHINE